MKIEDIKSRNDLPQFFVEQGYKVGAEIGVLKGEFTEALCQAGLKMYAIDPWIGFSGQGRNQKLQQTQDGYYLDAKKRLSPYHDCVFIRKTSMDALDDIGNGSLDFVYIDGDHNFKHVAEDIYEWVKKVKVGGIISGHDYWNTPFFASNVVCHVKVVVDAYVKLYGIKDLYILNRDKNPSWLWIKK